VPDPQPPHLADAMARFRAVADAAVQRGRRIAGDAHAAGAEFERESDEVVARLRHGEREQGAEPAAPDLRTAATEFRTAHGLAVPELPAPADHAADENYGEDYGGDYGEYADDPAPHPQPPPRLPNDDDDFSQFRVMRPL
jgi:hypothetical protein